MARNGSGTYIAPTGNPVVTNTTVTSAWANTTVTDIGSEITNSLPRDGQAPMLATLKLVSGTSNAPAVTFNSDPTTGAWYPGTGQLGLTTGGVDLLRLNSAGWARVAAGTTGIGSVQLGNSATTASNITFTNDGSGNLTIGTGAVGTMTTLVTVASTGAVTFANGTSSTLYLTAGGKLGLGASPIVSLDVIGTDGVRIPVGTTAQRPGTSALGMMRFNTDTAGYEAYGGSGWAPFNGSTTGFTPVAVSSNANATNGNVYMCDSSGGTFTLTLPASPSNLSTIAVCDAKGACGTNNVTVSRNGKTINGSATDLIIDVNRFYCELVYSSTSGDWSVIDISAAQAANGTAVGTLIGVRVFTSGGTYTPTQGTNFVIVEAVGGGGGGGGSTTTAGSQASLAGPGGSGAYGKAKFTSNFSGVTLTIGAAGAGGTSGATGGTGGTTSFGALLSCPGGGGGGGGGAAGNSVPFINVTLSAAAAPTGANIVGFGGQAGIQSQFSTLGTHFWGQGGSNPLGTGGCVFAAGSTAAGSGYGSGGSGHLIGSSTTGIAGGAGAPGVIIVYEYA